MNIRRKIAHSGFVDCKTIILILSLSSLFFTYVKIEKLKAEYENENEEDIVNSNNNENQPIVFIGGSPRSGTTLMRVILDAHEMVHCGEETRIVPRFIEFIKNQIENEFYSFKDNGITEKKLYEAAGSYIFEIVTRHGKALSPYVCTKDPTDLEYTVLLSKIFPKAKFLLMIRDARATVLSVNNRAINSGGYKIEQGKHEKNMRTNLINWNKLMKNMYSQCISVTDRCLPVFYEQLVLHPEAEIRKILNFLNIPWSDNVLKHDKYIGDKIQLSKTEKSSDQVIKPVNLEGLYYWPGKISNKVLDEIDTLAPLLKELGYDTKSKLPNYGQPDEIVLENMKKIEQNRNLYYDKAMNVSDIFKYIHGRI